MKNFKLFKLLLLGVVLITSIPQMSAVGVNGGTFYFDATNFTTTNYVQLAFWKCGDGDTYSEYFGMSHVDHTKLYYYRRTDAWSNIWYVAVIGNTSSWSSGSHCTNNLTDASSYTNAYNSNYTFNAYNDYYLYTSSNRGGTLVPTYGVPTKTQTVIAYLNGSQASTSPAQITISSYVKNGDGAVSANSATTSRGGSYQTEFACIVTAETTLSVSDIPSGTYFVGWYRENGTLISTNKSCPAYYASTDNTIHARFETKHTLTINAGSNGSTSPASGSTKTVGYYTTQSITATPAAGYYFVNWTTTGNASVASSTSATTTAKLTGGNGTVTANFAPRWRVIGGNSDSADGTDAMGDWNKDANPMTCIGDNCYSCTITLAASTNYKFKIYDKQYDQYWGCYATITTSVDEYEFRTSYNNNCGLTTGASGAGVYTFAWYAEDGQAKEASVYYPIDKDKITIKKNSVIYFDGTAQTDWDNANYTARFWFKNYASNANCANIGHVDCSKTNDIGIAWMYYATVPNSDYVGRVQMNRMNPSDLNGDPWNYASVSYAYSRDNAGQNCLVASGTGWDNIALTWKTYCPPMNTSTLTHDVSTVTYGGAGTKASPYLVAAGGSIKVSASATSKVTDGNMTTYYQFKKEGSEVRAGAATPTATITANGTNQKKDSVTVEAYNYYNSTSGTHLASSALYYESRTPYTISYNKGANGTGSRDNETKVYGVNFTLPSSAVFTRTGYNQTGWTTSDGGDQTHALGGSYTTDDNEEFFPVWTAKTTTVTLNANTSNHGSGDNQSVTATYDAELPSFTATTPATGYHLIGYFDNATSGTKIINADGTFASNSGIWNRTDGSTLTLWAHYEANTYTVVYHNNYPSGNRFNNGGAMSNQAFTYDAVQNLTANAFSCEGYNFAGWATTSDGSVAHTDQKSVSNLTTTNGGTVGLYAVWEDDNIYYFDGGASSDWEDDANWTKGKAPSSLADHEVRLLKHADIDNSTGTVHVKSVRIYMNGSYTPTGGSEITVSENGGYLYIWSRGALVVKNDILNYDMSTEETSPTTWRSLQIWADQYGSGALIVGDHQEGNKADVTFYTKACYGGSAGSYVNQFFGIPYTSSSPLNYYGVYLYKYNLNEETYEQSFDPASSGTMTPFTAYLMLRTDAEPGYCYTDGELILPGTGEYKAQNLDLVYSTTKGVSNMFANSWIGPIDLRAMDTEGGSNDFVGVEATFYMFNAGSSSDVGKSASEGNSPGQWTVLPVNAVKTDWAADGDLDSYAQYVIPSQQAFLVVATQSGTTHQLKLDYKKHVYDPAVANGVTIEPTRAPRREDFVLPEQMDLYVTGESGNSDRVIIYAREDFSTGFDNGWEGYKINGSNFAPQMYTLGDNGKMAINAIPDVEGSVIGFKPGTEDVQYTFTFKYRGENTWYLNDLKEQTSTLIDELDSYTFTSAEGDMEARFIISRTPIAYMPTGIDNGGGAVEGVSVRKLMIDGKLYIIRNGQMFTAEGQMVK